jgi:hypothetical protein
MAEPNSTAPDLDSTRRPKAYRQRKVPSGNKTDHVDAWSLAEALRVDGHGWKALAKEDPLVAELRLLCRDDSLRPTQPPKSVTFPRIVYLPALFATSFSARPPVKQAF